MKLWRHQEEALEQLHNGAVLVGGTGSGKSLTALSYYKKVLGESSRPPKALYIITTAKKRDDKDWQREAQKIGIKTVVVDSWNNIKKHVKISESFFIFDEQRVVGSGVWVKSFLKITKRNRWVLLSATPADTWMDLIPVFIANGFYRNRTEFIREHVVYAPHVTFPKITGYLNEPKLLALKRKVFVTMRFKRKTKSHTIPISVDYNAEMVKTVLRTQWNPLDDVPVDNLSQETFLIRKIINSHPSRILALEKIHAMAKKVIVFYNFNFELEALRDWFGDKTEVREWNGFKHEPVPDGEDWLYLVQYMSGSEAWECFTTNHMVFFSLSYSYRTMHQARGRINRHNTLFTDLYYYEFVSDSYLDKAIKKAFENKKDFNIHMIEDSRKKQRLL